jgi:hypothetical protein
MVEQKQQNDLVVAHILGELVIACVITCLGKLWKVKVGVYK